MAGTASYIPSTRSVFENVAHTLNATASEHRAPYFGRATNPINRPLYGFYVTPLRVVNQVIPVRLE